MDDLRARVKELFEEIEYVQLKTLWPERLVAAGIDEREAHKWAAEIGHVVNEYERSLRYLLEDMYEPNPRMTIPEEVNGWAAYTEDLTVFIIQGAMGRLRGALAKHIPPEPDDDEDSA